MLICCIGLVLVPGRVYLQCLSGDCENGQGVYTLPSGVVYKGEFQGAEIHGQGEYVYPDGSRISAKWVHRFPKGEGFLFLPNGKKITGHWSGPNLYYKDGTKSGQVLFQLDVGDIQSGCIQGNCQQGQGIYAYVDGSRYVGSFQNGKAEGQGHWFFPNGDHYKGAFHNNQIDGYGVFTDRTGKIIRGYWEEGLFVEEEDASVWEEGCQEGDCQNGFGVYTYSEQKARYRGAFKQGLPHGYGVAEYANGEHYYGQWKAGSFHGPGTLILFDGSEITGFWESGTYQGPLSSVKQIDSTLIRASSRKEDSSMQGNIFALIIGVSAYEHMPPLNFADDDAYRMYAFLRSPAGTAIPEEQIYLLIDEDATHDGINGALDSIQRMCAADDMLMIYFSGHGLPKAWLPVDFNGMENRYEYEDLIRKLEALPLEKILLIADACHSGSFYQEQKVAREQSYQPFQKLRNKDFALLTSSKSGESALEARGLRQGVFSHFLLRGLRGEADLNRDGHLQLDELFAFVEFNVRHYTQNKQSPSHFDAWQKKAFLPFVLKKS